MRSIYQALVPLLIAGNANAFIGHGGSSFLASRSANVALPKTQKGSGISMSLFPSHAAALDEPIMNNRHSASDWLYNVRSIPQSGVLREVRNPVMAVAGWSLFVSLVRSVLLAAGKTSLVAKMCIPATAHSFLVSSLGLLLVFRTNSAYQRFNEGRRIWETILSVSRNLSRMTSLYNKEIGKDRHRRILHLVAAFPYFLRHHVRHGCLCEGEKGDLDGDYRMLLQEPATVPVETRHDGDKHVLRLTQPKQCWVDTRNAPWNLFERPALESLAQNQNRPLWACDRASQEIMRIPYGPNFTSRERLKMLGDVEKLSNAVGQCERIHQTAVPLNYARHSLRSLTLWLLTVPFCMIQDLGLLTSPVCAALAWVLFGVYQIGYSIEDPFQGSLRLSILSEAIHRDVTGALGGGARTSAFDKHESEAQWAIYQNSPVSIEQLTSVDEKLLAKPRL